MGPRVLRPPAKEIALRWRGMARVAAAGRSTQPVREPWRCESLYAREKARPITIMITMLHTRSVVCVVVTVSCGLWLDRSRLSPSHLCLYYLVIGPSQRGVVRPPGGGQVGGHAGGQGVGLTPYTNLNPYDEHF